jgi:hypothetical protein
MVRPRAARNMSSSVLTLRTFSGSPIRSALISRMVILSINSPGAVSIATERVGTVEGTTLRSSAAIRSKAGAQSMNFC